MGAPGGLPISFPEVPIQKRNIIFPGGSLPDLPDQLMLLVRAHQEGSGKGIKFPLPGHSGGLPLAQQIAETTTLPFAVNNVAEVVIQWIIRSEDHLPVLRLGIERQGLFPPAVLRVWMDIGIIEVTVDRVPLVAQGIERVNGTRCATGVQ
jgi:hypothetical protein